MNILCESCNGVGWVCENHLESGADMDYIRCSRYPACNGCVVNCLCNPNGDEPEGFKTYAAVDPSKVKEWVQ